jgi:hypothetical protein
LSASCEEGSRGPARANWMPSGLAASEASKVAGEASRRSSLGDGSLRGRLLGIRRVRRFRWLFSGSSTISPQYPSSSTSRDCPGSRRQGFVKFFLAPDMLPPIWGWSIVVKRTVGTPRYSPISVSAVNHHYLPQSKL